MLSHENNCSPLSDIFFPLKKDHTNFSHLLKVILRSICKTLINGYLSVVIKGLIPAVNIIKSLIINVSSAVSFYLTLWTIHNSGHSIDHLLNNIKMFCFYFKLHRLTPFKICLRETYALVFKKGWFFLEWLHPSIFPSVCLSTLSIFVSHT